MGGEGADSLSLQVLNFLSSLSERATGTPGEVMGEMDFEVVFEELRYLNSENNCNLKHLTPTKRLQQTAKSDKQQGLQHQSGEGG